MGIVLLTSQGDYEAKHLNDACKTMCIRTFCLPSSHSFSDCPPLIFFARNGHLLPGHIYKSRKRQHEVQGTRKWQKNGRLSGCGVTLTDREFQVKIPVRTLTEAMYYSFCQRIPVRTHPHQSVVRYEDILHTSGMKFRFLSTDRLLGQERKCLLIRRNGSSYPLN